MDLVGAYTVPARLDVGALPLNPSLRTKLQAAGFRTTAEFVGIGPVDLATEAGISHEESLLALKVALPHSAAAREGALGGVSAQALYAKEAAARRIITFCSDLDAILGGGIAQGQVTEFCGVPGVGKTQIGMQLALTAQVPWAFGGVGGEAVYIDTEGSFMVERCVQMADAVVAHLRRVAQAKVDAARDAAVAAVSRDSLLAGIHLLRARDGTEQAAAVEGLPALLAERPRVRLVVLDSVTFHFRQGDAADMAARTRQLAHMAQQLMRVAGERDVAVVLANQMTTKVVEGGAARLAPALGDSWAHSATSRVILYWRDSVRQAFICKSPTQPALSAEYYVTAHGVRGRPRAPPKRPRPE